MNEPTPKLFTITKYEPQLGIHHATAAAMNVGECSRFLVTDENGRENAEKVARALNRIHGNVSAEVKTEGDTIAVIRIATRLPRKRAAKKAGAANGAKK